MSGTRAILMLGLSLGLGLGLYMVPGEAQAGWQGGRRAKCVKPDSELTTEQQQSLSAAVRGGTVVWNAAGQVDQASASASTHQVLSQNAFDQAWIRYELCMALDNNLIDQATYNRLLEQSLLNSMGNTPTSAAAAASSTRTPGASSTSSSSSGSTTTSDSTQWMQQIQAQTQLRSGPGFADMAAYGYSLMDVAKTGLLNASTSTNVPINLPSGYEYALMGVCDNDCADLDLTVLKGGMELSVDSSQDDWPVVAITPTGSPDYEVKVTMYQCNTSNCGYQLTVWRRPVQASAPPAAPSSSSQSALVAMPLGAQVQGQLSPGDHTLPNGEWADRYVVSLRAGQGIWVNMAANDLDPYLVALSPSGSTEENDDCDGDRARACLGFVAPEGGDWVIFATSYQGGDDGSYVLQVAEPR